MATGYLFPKAETGVRRGNNQGDPGGCQLTPDLERP